VTTRQSVMEHTELLFPGPIGLDIRPADRAIYVGTLGLHRDEFHEVTKAEVLDHFSAAYADLTRKFGVGLPLRKALFEARPRQLGGKPRHCAILERTEG
jgi:hypothetical protein